VWREKEGEREGGRKKPRFAKLGLEFRLPDPKSSVPFSIPVNMLVP
jgi:hypothetical protein